MNSDVIVVVPARGGSKRVHNKNIRKLSGKPLLAYTIIAAQEAGLGEWTFVSTDHPDIAAVAREYNAQVIDRPPELASDTASTEAALLHSLDWAKARDWRPDWVVTLPPTSPLRSSSTIARLVAEARNQPADCVFSLTENRGDFWRRDASGHFSRLFPDAPRRQQDREPLYEENSAIYVTRVNALRTTGSILGSTQHGMAIDPIEGFDINSELDFVLAKALFEASARFKA